MSFAPYSETIILRDAPGEITFEDLKERFSGSVTVDGYREIHNAFKGLEFRPTEADTQLITHVTGQSRSEWQSLVTGQICTLAQIVGLEFLYCDDRLTPDWEFELDSEMSITRGYLLGKKGLQTAIPALDDLYAWVKSNASKVLQQTELLYGCCGGTDELIKVMESSVPSGDPYTDCGYEDGDSHYYLFAYLSSIRKIMSNALENDKRLLHMYDF